MKIAVESVCFQEILDDPFNGASTFSLQCVVEAPVSAGARLDIVWFFTNTGGNTVLINEVTFTPLMSIVSQNQTVRNGELVKLTSTITFGRFSDPIHAGNYFCQAQLDGATSSLFPSNAITFTTDDAVFNFSPCGINGGMGLADFTQTARRCAGSISSSTVFVSPATTVALTSTSQSGHSTSSPPPVVSSGRATPPTTDKILLLDITTTISTQSPSGRLKGRICITINRGAGLILNCRNSLNLNH